MREGEREKGGGGTKKMVFIDVLFFFSLCVSFNSEFQLVMDARILLTVQEVQAAGVLGQEVQELLHPKRHQITLPLNGLNMLFSDYMVAVNHHTKLDSDR